MGIADEWHGRIEASRESAPVPATAHTYRVDVKFGSSHTNPVVFACSDQREYVVKGTSSRKGGHDLRRDIVSEQVMGWLATSLEASVPPVAVVDVSSELVNNHPDLQGFPVGLAHGCRYLPDASRTKQGIAFTNVPENRGRFATLAIMYGWACVQCDHQFFYLDGSNLVVSFDHGHFFPAGPNWTVQSLGTAPAAAPDAVLVNGCHLTAGELSAAAQQLSRVTPTIIASAVASPPDDWGVSMDERVALAVYLDKRREQLLATIGA